MSNTSTISLSKSTLGILKVASLINPSFLAKKGKEIRSINEAGSIFLQAKIEEEFPRDFAIYELQRLLSVLNANTMAGAELTFADDQDYMDIKAGKSSVRYNFADPSYIKYKDKDLVVDNENLVVTLSDAQIADIRKMASVLGHSHIIFRVTPLSVDLVITTPNLSTASNDFTINLNSNETNAPEKDYKIKIENLVLLDGSYKVTIFKGVVSQWLHEAGDVSIFIGLEKE